MRVDREPAFVLHTRAYRETSQLVDLLTPNYGRVRLVSRGGRAHRKLQPFVEHEVAWSGRSDLKTLARAEPRGNVVVLRGAALYSGLYVNELLIRLVHESDCHFSLFNSYRYTLQQLAFPEQLETALRLFELTMLRELGYGLELESDALSGELIEEDAWYWFDPLLGLEKRYRRESDRQVNWFAGSSLIALHRQDFSSAQTRRDAKRLLRLALQPLLGDKPLKSRELFVSTRSSA